MELLQKLEILSDAAKYDVSCSSSGSTRKNTPGGIGSVHKSGICHSWSDDGRCISLLKILLTNSCIYDCAYCANRCSSDIRRAAFTPEEVADLTINFYRRNYIEGLFLSSAVFKSPDYTMELLCRSVSLLREKYRFNGYIHLKSIPGADQKLVYQAGRLVDRMSVNIELPTENSLKLLAPQKKKEDIIRPMAFLHSKISEQREDSRHLARTPGFVPAGQSTQLIIGATPDHDLDILNLSENLYGKFRLKRVFYSAYMPVSDHPKLPKLSVPPLLREHRLYQADWLLRFYGFKVNELLDDNSPDFDTELDPKADWALRNIHQFPLEINKADYHMLLRVPGIGVKSARKIVEARRLCSLNFEDLKKIGIVLKRARYFITCKGKFYGDPQMDRTLIKSAMVTADASRNQPPSPWQQLSIFQYSPASAYIAAWEQPLLLKEAPIC